MQDLTLLPVFASPLAVYNLGSSVKELNKQLVKDIDSQVKSDPRKRSFFGARQTRLGIEDTFFSFKELHRLINPLYISMMARYGAPKEVMKQTYLHGFWGNVIDEPGGFAEDHTHGNGNTFFTGVYYPAGNEDENLDEFDYNNQIVSWETVRETKLDVEGFLQIKSPGFYDKKLIRPNFQYNHTTLFDARLVVRPRQSMVIMFPAYLSHMVFPVKTNLPRYSISFAVDRVK